MSGTGQWLECGCSKQFEEADIVNWKDNCGTECPKSGAGGSEAWQRSRERVVVGSAEQGTSGTHSVPRI